jgi:dihydroorotase
MSPDQLFGRHATSLIIRRPDDRHVHLRDSEMLKAVLPYTIAQFARAEDRTEASP